MLGDGGPSFTLPNEATTVAAFLDSSPSGAGVFLAHGMACVGCSLSRFDTLADAARAYGLPLDGFLHELASTAGSFPGRTR
jgi:hybrid cluster-associated redox disulfide protein